MNRSSPVHVSMHRALGALGAMLVWVVQGCVPLTLPPAPNVRVVQLIPSEIADEEMENPEPSIAVNPANPLEIVASAYMVGSGDPCAVVPEGVDAGDAKAGTKLLRSIDGGVVWSLQCVPTLLTTAGAGDASLDFDAGQKLYVSFIDPSYFGILIQAVLVSGIWSVTGVTSGYAGTDMPWAAAAAGGAWYSFGLPISPDAGSCMGGFVTWGNDPASPTKTCVSSRTTSGDDYVPHVKTVAHGDGTMYALAYRPISVLPLLEGIKADVVLRRHDPGTTPAFEALLDAPASPSPAATCTKRDGKPGLRLARCVLVPTSGDDWDSKFGNQRRTASQVALAVSPGNSKRVAIVYGDSTPGDPSGMTLHVRISDDGGVTKLDTDVLAVKNATNPALAFSSSGRLGFSYQLLEGLEWHTTFVSLSSSNSIEYVTVLAKVPFSDPAPRVTPYIGDYMDLASAGEDFFGVFSAGGRYDLTRFPQGLTSYRTAPGSGVDVTIDPFFFRISPSCASVEVTPTSLTLALGTMTTLTAVAKDAYGNVLPSAVLVWASSSAAVATVGGTGTVVAAGVGTAVIIVRCGEASGAFQLTVAQPSALN